MPIRLATGFILVALGTLLSAELRAQRPSPLVPSLDELIAAQDSRAGGESAISILRAGAMAPDPALRAFAVRALGRTERPEVLAELARSLGDEQVTVRIAAADAVAQAVSRGEGVGSARALLLERLAVEGDPAVVDQLAESLGRLRSDSAVVPSVARTLVARLPARGAVRGMFFLARQGGARGAVPLDARDALQGAATNMTLPEDVRATAAAARVAAGGMSLADQEAMRSDPAGSVRALVPTAGSISDPDPYVRYRALPLAGCDALITATEDPNMHVALGALDALARCPGSSVVAALERSDSPRALVSLASVAPERARIRLAAVAADADPFVRVHASRAAVRLRDTVALRALASDADPNVASEAIAGLASLTDHEYDHLYIAALQSDAAQLLMAAGAALRDTVTRRPSNQGVLDALVAAMDRVSALRRETSRDARIALVDAMGIAVPERYLRDFDPVVAERVARLLGRAAAPEPLPPLAPPTEGQLRAIGGATIYMDNGGVVELELHPFDAPTNVWRFVRLARQGYFDGLTFHRIAPFFVVQGGSPLANEYVGDGPFTRDEVGLENRRGTVGISTRGRDTGDGQIFINTVDNVRLDHDYTVFARVVSGMEIVDRMGEGARIERVVVHDHDR